MRREMELDSYDNPSQLYGPILCHIHFARVSKQ